MLVEDSGPGLPPVVSLDISLDPVPTRPIITMAQAAPGDLDGEALVAPGPGPHILLLPLGDQAALEALVLGAVEALALGQPQVELFQSLNFSLCSSPVVFSRIRWNKEKIRDFFCQFRAPFSLLCRMSQYECDAPSYRVYFVQCIPENC
jgi:hypothetical protein